MNNTCPSSHVTAGSNHEQLKTKICIVNRVGVRSGVTAASVAHLEGCDVDKSLYISAKKTTVSVDRATMDSQSNNSMIQKV